MGLFVFCAVPTIAFAAPEFLQYEGRNAVHDGQGGERKTVEGIDFWLKGDPPRHYQVLGSLNDKRHKTGLYGAIRMSGLESDIAKAARAAGGDAVIIDGEQDETTAVVGSAFGNVNGTYGGGAFNANRSTVGITRAIKDHDSQYIVVKYLADPASPSTATTIPAQPSTPQPAQVPLGVWAVPGQ